jgi:hypothetical protein
MTDQPTPRHAPSPDDEKADMDVRIRRAARALMAEERFPSMNSTEGIAFDISFARGFEDAEAAASAGAADAVADLDALWPGIGVFAGNCYRMGFAAAAAEHAAGRAAADADAGPAD